MDKHMFANIAKGLAVGGSMLIPGVSGGTMAIILGIYDDLIGAISSFFRHKRKSIRLLGSFGIGAVIGILLFSKPLLYLTESYYFPMMYLFMGAVAGSIPMICRKAKATALSPSAVLYTVLGISIVLLFTLIPSNLFAADLNTGPAAFFLMVAAGIVAAVALVLPGISVSYLLLLMGMYDETMRAINGLFLPYLIPLGIGLLLGIGLSTRALERALTQHTRVTYLVILGFILGSLLEVFPGIPSHLELIICPVLFLSGFFLIRKLSQLDQG